MEPQNTALCLSPKLSSTGAVYASTVPSGDQAGGLAPAVTRWFGSDTVASGPCAGWSSNG